MTARAPRVPMPGAAPQGRGGPATLAAVPRTGHQSIFHLHGSGVRQLATLRPDALAWRGKRARGTAAQHDSIETICGRLAAIHNDLAGAR